MKNALITIFAVALAATTQAAESVTASRAWTVNYENTVTLPAAAADATTKANAAKTSAISTAATDATTKANTAKSEAIAAAATDATTKANSAKSAAISTAAADATAKANAIGAEVVSTVETYTQGKIDEDGFVTDIPNKAAVGFASATSATTITLGNRTNTYVTVNGNTTLVLPPADPTHTETRMFSVTLDIPAGSVPQITWQKDASVKLMKYKGITWNLTNGVSVIDFHELKPDTYIVMRSKCAEL